MFEFLAIVLLIVLLIILLVLKSDVQTRLSILQTRIDQLTAELKRQRELPAKPAEEKKVATEPNVEKKIVHQESKPNVTEEPTIKIPVKPEEKPPVIVQPINRPPVPQKPAAPKKPGFFERNPDLEKFIGENLANKIGIAVLVLGIGFFVKYAIDQNWIGIYGRVAIGVLCGGLLLGLAHWLRKSFVAFSSVLVGGGIAVLYLTIAIAFHEYQIFSQTVAFLLMVIITGFTILLSVTYNRIELAVLAILGGFASPFMVSTGEGNYVVLFTYVLILDAGMLVLAYYKKWNLVNIVSYAFTLLLFSSWLSVRFDNADPSMVRGALIFATLFYVVFFAMNIVHNIRENVKFKALEITLLLSNTFFYFAAGMIILSGESGEGFKGLFTAALAVFNFVFAYLLYKNQRVDRNLIYMLIGFVLTFISLAAPIQLEGNYITLFWAAEAVLLLWLSQKSGITLMKIASAIVTGLMLISLIMDWNSLYFAYDADPSLVIILNKGYITGIVSLISLVLSTYLLRFEKTFQEYIQPYKILLTISALGVLYATNYFELQHQLNIYFSDDATITIIIGTYNMLYIMGLLLSLRKLIPAGQKAEVAGFLGVISIFSFFVFYHHQFVSARDSFAIFKTTPATGFIFHYLYLALLLVIAVVSLRNIQKLEDFNSKSYNIYSWFYVFFFVFAATAELDHTVVLLASPDEISLSHIISQNSKIGYPILWGIASFILIAVGLKTKKKHLRIISLTLLLVTLIKLFFVDIRGISEGGKIAAFISLGILLLVVSFMYQRLKKILLADDQENIKTNDSQ
ncbi:MAG: DUF2339 domain-containing protein [Cyclobacteriaceae bacterium]|nr:DUF2339 domain-containing protein [Cyclobacteriaceae bacterium]